MTKEQAVQLLTQVCAIYKGTLEEHTALQQALEVVKKLEAPKEPKK
jgi:hypothetical protein